jgi:hypothetical protein
MFDIFFGILCLGRHFFIRTIIIVSSRRRRRQCDRWKFERKNILIS